jgi:predicted porin
MKTSRLPVLVLGCSLATVSTFATAQSTVNLYGLADLSIGSTKAPGGASVTEVSSGKMTTSFIGMSGREDLGQGLAALFRFEGFVRMDTGAQGRFNGDPTWSRTASVGLAHKDYGTLTLGRNTTPLFVSSLLFNALGDSFGYSPTIRHYYTSGTVTGDSGWNQSVAYASPTWSGFRFGVIGATKDTSNGPNWGVNLGYGRGPLALALVFQDVEKDGAAPVNDTSTTQFSASYDLGVAKLFAQYGQVENNTTGAEFDIAGLGVRAPMGKGALVAQWGLLDPEVGAKRNTVSLGYLYGLSKRTEVYAVAMHDKVSGLSSGGGYSVGVRHRF